MYKLNNMMKKAQEKLSHALTAKNKKVIISIAVGILAAGTVYFGGKQYVNANTIPYYRVYVGDQEVGTISNIGDLKALYKKKEQEFSSKYPDVKMKVHTEGIYAVEEKAYKPSVESEETLDKLYGMLKGYANGVALQVDDKVIGIVKDEQTANAVLEQIKNIYSPRAAASMGFASKVTRTSVKKSKASVSNEVILESIDFREDITTATVDTDPNKIMDVDTAVNTILEGDEAAVTYTIKEGDTISAIAKRYGITQKELRANNPGIEEFSLQIGDEVNVKAIQAALTVRTVERLSEELVIEPQVVYRNNDEMRSGETKVISEGKSGMKTMIYRVTKDNGEIVAEEWVGQLVTKPSEPKIVMKGTKVVLGEGSGDFAWPVTNPRMSSSYGKRWGRTHKGIDLVSSKRNILASDSGVVTFAGTKSGYGNCIIIDHKNGYETLYGHLSEIGVEKGDVIEQGDKIGVMGNTGRSTGTHLHFEIIKNGSAQNPMKYL